MRATTTAPAASAAAAAAAPARGVLPVAPMNSNTVHGCFCITSSVSERPRGAAARWNRAGRHDDTEERHRRLRSHAWPSALANHEPSRVEPLRSAVFGNPNLSHGILHDTRAVKYMLFCPVMENELGGNRFNIGGWSVPPCGGRVWFGLRPGRSSLHYNLYNCNYI